MLGPFATTSRLTPIQQMSLAVLSRSACESMSTTTTTTTTRDRGNHYGPMEWAQLVCWKIPSKRWSVAFGKIPDIIYSKVSPPVWDLDHLLTYAWFVGSHTVHRPNGISIGSAVFAQLTIVPSTQPCTQARLTSV